MAYDRFVDKNKANIFRSININLDVVKQIHGEFKALPLLKNKFDRS